MKNSHHYVIFDKLPNLVENSKFFNESSILLILDTFTNILAYLIKHRQFRIHKSRNWGHSLRLLRYWATLDDIFNNKKTQILLSENKASKTY